VPLFFLALAMLGSVVLVPIIAACIVWLEPDARGSRSGAWLGLSIGMGTASTIPLFSLFITIAGQAWGYRLAPLFGLASFLLGAQIVRVHLRRLRGTHGQSRPTAYACIAFGMLVAAALTPVIAGAAPPAACGEFGAESCGPGDLSDYAMVVVPIVLAMSLEAWMMMRSPRIRSPMNRSPVAA